MPIWLQAGVWGVVAGSALVIGAVIGYFTKISHRIIASIMAFGSGMLISALSFDLVEEAHKRGGFLAAAIGFFVGAWIFTGANLYLAHRGAAARKLSGQQQPSEAEDISPKSAARCICKLSGWSGFPDDVENFTRGKSRNRNSARPGRSQRAPSLNHNAPGKYGQEY